MTAVVTPAELSDLLHAGSPLALLDVREHGEFNAAHISGATSLPRRLIEFRARKLVPCGDVLLVVCDDDGRRARLAARTFERVGYSRVAVLEGGINRWASEGQPTEWGLNVPSKAFGERVEVEHKVTTIDALELDRRIQNGESVLILDARTPEEFHEFCIPGGRSLPGGELTYRVGRLLRDSRPDLVVVNCAGRTRSIIGARILQRMGLQDVVSLKNGTAGWTLAGLSLERGADRLRLPEPDAASRAEAEAFAARIVAEDGVARLRVEDLHQVMTSGCVYLVDVRTEAEYLAGHIPGFTWFPGGQAVQRADDLVAVRAAHVVFCCDGVVRSSVAASWFRQMGFPNVSVVDGGTEAWRARGHALVDGPDEVEAFGLAEALTRVNRVTPTELHAQLTGAGPGPTLLCVDTSRQFARGHVPGARWLSRSWLELEIASIQADLRQPLVVTDTDGRGATLAAGTLLDMGYQQVWALTGGMLAWRGAGLPEERGLSGVMQPPDDVVLSGLERSAAEAIEYLRWETALAPAHAANP
jgi:rhodanese-related sulfurtransferase